MANIRVDVNYTIADGNEIVFRSPVDCSEITGLIVYYPTVDGNTTSKVFALADAHGNNVGDIDHLFAENVAVKVILDVTEGMAFVQNADTNAYIERTFAKLENVGIIPEASGNTISIKDSSDVPLMGMKLYGKTVQDGTPTPEAPVELVSAGEGGSIGVTIAGSNLIQYPYVETSKELYGVTFTDNGDGSISISGTATSNANFWLNYVNNSTLTNLGICRLSSGTANMVDEVMWTTSYGSNAPRCNLNTNIDLTGKTVGLAITVMKGATVNTTIYPMLNVGNTALAYEPYKETQTVSASAPSGLHSIGEVKDEIDFARGVRVSNIIKLVFDGTESWIIVNGLFRVDTADGLMTDKYEGGRQLCNYFRFGASSLGDGQFGFSDHLYFKAGAFATVDDWKAWLAEIYASGNPLTVLGILSEPMETPLSADELAAFAKLRAHKPNTSIFNDGDAPMSVEYVADTKAYIDNKFNELAAALVHNT